MDCVRPPSNVAQRFCIRVDSTHKVDLEKEAKSGCESMIVLLCEKDSRSCFRNHARLSLVGIVPKLFAGIVLPRLPTARKGRTNENQASF